MNTPQEETKSKTLTTLESGEIKFSCWNFGNNKSAPASPFDDCMFLISKTKGKTGAKLDKVLTSSEYLQKSIALIDSKTGRFNEKLGGTIEVQIKDPKNTGLFKTVKLSEDGKFFVNGTVSCLSKKERKDKLGIPCQLSDTEPAELIDLLALIDEKAQAFVDEVNDLWVDSKKIAKHNISYRKIISDDGDYDDSIWVQINMEKEKDTNLNKFVSIGYPKNKILNESKIKTIRIGKTLRMVPQPFPREDLHESKIHKLFGVRSTIVSNVRFDWTWDGKSLAIKIVCNGAIRLLSVENDPELSGLNRLDIKFPVSTPIDENDIGEDPNAEDEEAIKKLREELGTK